MPMPFFNTAISGSYPDIVENNNRTFLRIPFFRVYINPNVRVGWIGIGIFYPSGEPILLGGVGWLHRYRAFAVDNHSCIPCASHPLMLEWGGGSRLVNNPG
jgi:hypothetical protein